MNGFKRQKRQEDPGGWSRVPAHPGQTPTVSKSRLWADSQGCEESVFVQPSSRMLLGFQQEESPGTSFTTSPGRGGAGSCLQGSQGPWDRSWTGKGQPRGGSEGR